MTYVITREKSKLIERNHHEANLKDAGENDVFAEDEQAGLKESEWRNPFTNRVLTPLSQLRLFNRMNRNST